MAIVHAINRVQHALFVGGMLFCEDVMALKRREHVFRERSRQKTTGAAQPGKRKKAKEAKCGRAFRLPAGCFGSAFSRFSRSECGAKR